MAGRTKKRSSWRTPFHPDEVIQRVRPTQSDEYLFNPHKGTTTFQRFNGDPLNPGLSWSDSDGPEVGGFLKPFRGDPRKLTNDRYPDTTISYCRWVWSVIEPEKGKYRWDLIDGALEAAAQRGQTLQARLQPNAGEAPYPDWFWATGVSRCPKVPSHPDFNSPQYIKHWTELIRAFGRRYDGHPNLESFDIAYAGGCGETGGNSTPETAAILVDAYLDSMPKTQLVSMLGTPGCAYAAGKRPGIGFRFDCYGDVHTEGQGYVPENKNWNHMYEAYPREIVRCGVQDAWKTAPVTMETCWTVGYWHKQGWDIDFILDYGLKVHGSVFMPKSSYIPARWMKKVLEFNKRLGYRFVLRQLTLPLEAKPGSRIKLDWFIDNIGCAPIYRPYKLAVRFRQGKTEAVVPLREDIRRWLPDHTWFGEEIVFPRTLKRGEVKVDVGIVDPGTNAAKVCFAIREVLADGWHPMTSMDVL